MPEPPRIPSQSISGDDSAASFIFSELLMVAWVAGELSAVVSARVRVRGRMKNRTPKLSCKI